MINLDRFGGVTEPEDGVYFMTNDQMEQAKKLTVWLRLKTCSLKSRTEKQS